MLKVSVSRVRPDKVARLKEWLAEVSRRADEARETYANEGVTHEQGSILDTTDGPVFVYAMELADYEAAVQAFEKSRFAIDAEHKSVMADVLDGEVKALLLFGIHL
jgi:hypothetical protein